MSITIAADNTVTIPIPHAAPVVQWKQEWSDPWANDPDLQVVSLEIHASSRQVSACQILRRYGKTKFPHETTAYTTREALNLTNAWIRVMINGGSQGPLVQFVGQVEAPTRVLKGNVDIPAGDQAWIAVGGLRFLQKMDISQSIHRLLSGQLATAGWIPAMNSRDKHNSLVGNRADTPNTINGQPIYCYGGKSVWTHRQYVDYLIANFVQQYDDESAPKGPIWTLGGQTDILDGMKTTIRFNQAGSIAEQLAQLINPRYGVDYFVKPTTAGFEIHVYALSSDIISFAGTTLPRNPNTVAIVKDDAIDIVDVKLVETNERRVDQIIVLGKRIVVCGTLRGTGGYTNGASDGPETLTAKWSAALEADYIAAGGLATGPNSDAEQNDRVRKSEKYRNVYQLFGAPANWNQDGGIWGVVSGDDGSITNEKNLREKAERSGETTPPNYSQNAIRETLSWTPLKEGFDYTQDPAVDNTLGDGTTEAQLKPPVAWILNETPDNNDTPTFVPCDQNTMSVHALDNDWGVFVNASPNHAIALNHWTDAQMDSSELDEQKFDFTTLVATLAIESDHRLHLAFALPGSQKAGDGSVMTVLDEEAECWVLLPGTTVDVDSAGVQLDSGDTMRVLRNDVDRLGLIMAGLIARYKNERVRAVITINSHVAYGSLLGQILDVVQQGDDINKVGGPITSIEWFSSPPRTIVKTGYA